MKHEALGFNNNNSKESHIAIPDDPKILFWSSLNTSIVEDYNSAINLSRSPEENAEILDGSIARSVLPYLSLVLLSDQEKASLISLGEMAARNSEAILERYGTLYSITDDYVAAASGEGEAHSDCHITKKLAEARKLFCGSLIDRYNHSDIKERETIRQAFFSSSPDAASYVGGLRGSVELLTIADRANTGYAGPKNNIREEVIYEGSFASYNVFDEILSSEANSLTQLKLLPTFYNLTKSCSPDNYTSNTLYCISESFTQLADNPSTTPLVRLVADSLNREITNDLNTEWIFIDPADPEYAELFKKDAERRDRILAEQDLLHEEFPDLPKGQFLTRIAPGVATTINGFNQIDLISTTSGEQASVLDYKNNDSIGLNQDSALLLATAHNPDIEPLIDAQLSFSLSDISLPAQIQLLKFMTEAGDTRYDLLCNAMKNFDNPEMRQKFAESFLATDFGEDFGDSLLTIAGSESLSVEEKEKIFDRIESCRESIAKITDLYKEIDNGEFAKQYSRAANERLTDAIMAFGQIAEDGIARADLDWVGEVSLDYDKAMEALDYETNSLSVIDGTFDDVLSGTDGAFVERILSPDENHQRSIYNLFSPNHGYVMLYVRPEGSNEFDPQIEYGKFRSRFSEEARNAGIEASISMITNPVDPFALPSPFRPDYRKLREPNYYDSQTMDKVSAIRLDREGRAPSMAPDDPRRDPISPEGMVSVDLAAIGDRADTPSGKIARLFSLGNKLRAESFGKTGYSLNHNTNWFAHDEYGSADGFKRLADYVDSMANALCVLRPPKKGEGISGETRKVNRRRGGRVLRRAA